MERETDPEDKWLPELSFSTVLTMVGIGLTAADLFFRFYRSKKEKDSYDLTPVHMVSEPGPQQKACGGPRIGMV